LYEKPAWNLPQAVLKSPSGCYKLLCVGNLDLTFALYYHEGVLLTGPNKMIRQPYIVDGEIVRDQRRTQSSLHYFSRPRFLTAFGVCLVLAISNPANEHVFGNLPVLGAKKSPLSNSSTNKRFLKPRVTNYGIFSIEERFDAVLVSGLLQSWTCSYYDRDLGPLCEVIGKRTTLV
jgi:hypothetical protein